MQKLPARHTPIVFAVLMSCVMAFIVTCVVTAVNTGLAGDFGARWMKAFIIAWPVAGSCILLFRPRVQRLTSFLTAH